MKTTALYKTHKALGAKMVPFAGYTLPVSYVGVTVEHQTVRKAVGVFDISHMGEFLIEGPNALALLQKVTANNVAALAVGQVQYNYFPNETGGIVDDLLVYRIKEEAYLLVVNAANIEKDWNHIVRYNTSFGATMQNLSDTYALLAVQGPKAVEALQSLTSVNLSDIPFYTFVIDNFAGIAQSIISATGYTGSGGFEIYCKNTDVQQVWDAIIEAGAPFGIQPIGLAARDTLRLEMGYCLYGNDIDETTSPLEAGLGWITKFSKDFVNCTALAQEKKKGIPRKRIAFQLEERGIPRKGYSIIGKEGSEIGKVTSGTMSPSLSRGIGLGYVPTAYAKVGRSLYIQIRNHTVPATIVQLPFYKSP